MKAILLAAVLSITAVTPLAAQEVSEPPIVAEARSFMDGYADDIREGDAAAVAARYAPGGAWMVQHGSAFNATHQQITTRYTTQWEGPAAFAWRDLTFVPVDDDAITVIGRFDWTTPEGEVQRMTYNGLLVRSAGELRIRIEDEAPVPDDAP